MKTNKIKRNWTIKIINRKTKDGIQIIGTGIPTITFIEGGVLMTEKSIIKKHKIPRLIIGKEK